MSAKHCEHSLARAALDLVYVRGFQGDAVIRSDRPVVRAAAMAALALALGLTLSACGRKGPLDPPPGAQLAEPGTDQAQQQQQLYDSGGRPIAPPGQKKRLLIDGLLD